MSNLPKPKPRANLETRAFWDATAEGRFLLPRCDACQTIIWTPRSFCPNCASTAVSWTEASGQGTIYSFSIIRKGQGQYRESGPYVLAYVELAEGPRVMTNIVDCDPESLSVGQAVRVVWDDTGEGPQLYRFTPA